MISAARDTASTAYSGTRFAFSRRNNAHPGIPRSRENAYQVREALVSPAAPQKNCPTVAIRITSFAAHAFMEVVKIVPTNPALALIAFTSVAANRNARSNSQPITADQHTDRHTPWAAAFAAPLVSSAVCADAS